MIYSQKSILKIIGREKNLFNTDVAEKQSELLKEISKSSFLVLGAAGSIGQAVTKEILKRNPKKLYAVDISENNLVELVRDIRSSIGYIDGDFKTFALDIGSLEYKKFIDSERKFDYVINLSALKHVRSEEDVYTLMRMIDVNIFNTEKTIKHAINNQSKKYFCVSTDKAANPVNLMGASKRVMELFLMEMSNSINISTARFANVAFSDGSLLHGFNERIKKEQPLVAPKDIKRYFLTYQEAGELCLMSIIFGANNDIFFPKLEEKVNLIPLSEIAIRYINMMGYEPYLCSSEEEARELAAFLPSKKQWPLFLSQTDTAGEKSFEEFYTLDEILDTDKFESIGIIKPSSKSNLDSINYFKSQISSIQNEEHWNKDKIIELFEIMIPNFKYIKNEKYLDGKM